MHKTALKIFILSLNCFVIFGLSFLKPDLEYRQGQDDDIGIVPESLENENGFRSSETNAFIPNSYYMSGVPSWRSDSENAIHRTESDDDDETLVDKRAMPFENKFFGARGKRYGFMSFLPTRYSGWYSRIDTEPSPRKRYHPNMFVSMRGKRLSDAGYRTLEDYFGIPDDFHQSKRYQGFTALRGRRSVES